MKSRIVKSLDTFPSSAADYDQWLKVGMALKYEGFPVQTWVDWSKSDVRFKEGECEKKWETFTTSETPVTGATILYFAKKYKSSVSAAASSATASAGISASYQPGNDYDPIKDLTQYLSTLYRPEDIVSYVSTDMTQSADGKWKPRKGVYKRTAADLLNVAANAADVTDIIGPCKPEAGAFIRINPMDGKGISDSNVTEFRYVVVESDSLELCEQERLLHELRIPIKMLVYSGNKSLHAIVAIDAADKSEFSKRVSLLYNYLDRHGYLVDRANRNPSRLSRMPGVKRGDKWQYIVDTNIGDPTWDAWAKRLTKDTLAIENSNDSVKDDFPMIETTRNYFSECILIPPPLIEGLLHRGQKMIITGASKTGKTTSLIELAFALTTGQTWFGLSCVKSRVLFINFEVQKEFFLKRAVEVKIALGLPGATGFDFLTLRGYRNLSGDNIAQQLIAHVKPSAYDIIIIDPIYKMMTGDENNAQDIIRMCLQLDSIAANLNCSIIYSHHHSKGNQGFKNAMDRASGSGVFGRDCDVLLDLIELNDTKVDNKLGQVALRAETCIRNLPRLPDINLWFDYPRHIVDSTGELASASPRSSNHGNGGKQKRKDNGLSLDEAYELLKDQPFIRLETLAVKMGVSTKTARVRINARSKDYAVVNGIVRKLELGK